jgi:sulfite reductase (NADPH) flavoprotein alpha-component
MENGAAIRYLTAAPAGAPAGSLRQRWLNSVRFPTESGRACFLARPCLPPAELPDASHPFVLVTGRVAHQWHTLTKTGKVAALNKLNPGPFVEIHPEDAATLGVTKGALVKVGSRHGFSIYPAVLTPRVRPGNCFAPIHWNDQFGEHLAVNAVTGEAVDAISLQPEFKFTAVSLTRVQVPEAGGFTAAQLASLNSFLSGFTLLTGANRSPLPELPESAPFTAGQRTQINQMLRQLCQPPDQIPK